MGAELKREDYLSQDEIAWMDALRSGKYQRTGGQLRYGDTYCCLGVLCDISKIGNWKYKYDKRALYNYEYKCNKETRSNSITLPNMLALKLNIPDDMLNSLMSMNDAGFSFNEIADYYEKWRKETYLNKMKGV